MRRSLALLTSAVLAGTPAFAADYPTAQTNPQPQVIQVSPADAPPPSPTSFRERLRNFFRPHRNATPSQSVTSDRLTPMPVDKNMMTVSPQGLTTSKDLEGVGHEKDYSWITGRLARVPGDSSHLMIRYANPNEMDTYGGTMILAGADLTKYHEGDLVCVYGKVTNAHRLGKNGPGATYQTSQIYLIPPTAAHR